MTDSVPRAHHAPRSSPAPPATSAGELVPALLDAGLDGARAHPQPRRASRASPWREDVEVVEGDATSPDDLGRALDGADVAYYLLHSMDGQGELRRARPHDGAGLRRRSRRRGHRAGSSTSAACTRRASCPSTSRRGSRWARSSSPARCPPTVLQAGVVLGDGSASFDMLRHLTERLPAMVAPKWVDNRIQPIAVDDVVHYLVGAADLPAGQQPHLRHRRPRGADLRRHDAALRRGGRPGPPPDRVRAGAVAPAGRTVGRARHADLRRHRPARWSAAWSTRRSATRTTRRPRSAPPGGCRLRRGRPGRTAHRRPPALAAHGPADRRIGAAAGVGSLLTDPRSRGTPRSTSPPGSPPGRLPVVWTASTPRSPCSPPPRRPCSPSVAARRPDLDRALAVNMVLNAGGPAVLPRPPPLGRRRECAALTAAASTSPDVWRRPDGVRPPDCSRVPGGAPSPPPSPQPLPDATRVTDHRST